MRASPLTDTVSPVSVQELEKFLDVEDDPTLEDYLSIATDAVIAFLNVDLLPRQWKYVQNIKRGSLTVNYNRYPVRDWGYVSLPYTALITVDDVEVDGEPVDFEVDIESRPGQVYPEVFGDQLVVIYTAGASHVPATIKTGIKMVASYLYEHAGACDVSHIISKSGAEGVLRQYRVEW